MKKVFIISAIILLILLILTTYILFFFPTYRIEILHPADSSLIASDFFITVSICGKPVPDILEIKIDENTIETIHLDELNWNERNCATLYNFKIDISNIKSGNHILTARVKDNLLPASEKYSITFEKKDFKPFEKEADSSEISKIESFFTNELPDLIVTLNNTRLRHPDKWTEREEYKQIKDSVFNYKIPISVLERIKSLIENIEKKSSPKEIKKEGDYLNIELCNNGYPFWTLMYEYRFDRGDIASILLTYKIIERMNLEIEGMKEQAYVLKRLDNINRVELFLGKQINETPAAIILENKIRELSDRLKIIYAGRRIEQLRTMRDMLYFGVPVSTLDFFVKSINSEVEQEMKDTSMQKYNTIEEKLYNMCKKPTVYHELRHLEDFKNGIALSNTSRIILDNFIESNPIKYHSIDNYIEYEKFCYNSIVDINLELSAYLYELAYASGLRKYLLIKLANFILNKQYINTPEHWASKAILWLLARKNNMTDKNFLLPNQYINRDEWKEILIKLHGVNNKKLEQDIRDIYVDEFKKKIF
ncbi:MAG: hypothetical protein FJ216_05480 [Ignavibacteria bacterium]|nr:hypothetical protein [Ignavibacteria bacterium]